MGEGMSSDAAIMPYISSANIACGYHAGDQDTMKRTIHYCLENGVAIGAHPSYNDRADFGRRDLLGSAVRMDEIPELITTQLNTLQNLCLAFGTRLHHVKPHGALYNRAARDLDVAILICEAVRTFDPALAFYGLSGSHMKTAATMSQLRFASEVFADRAYAEDGSLVPRSQAGSLIETEKDCEEQVLRMVQNGEVLTLPAGKPRPVNADTICIHGDGPKAIDFAKAVYHCLNRYHIGLKAL